MITNNRCLQHRFTILFSSAVTALAMLANVTSVEAADLLAYSFETFDGPFADGFVPNGGSYSQDTIGATQGTHSLLAVLGTADGFVGTYSFSINPTPGGAVIGDPPGIDHVLFDLTISAGEEFIGAFANMGIIMFGCDQNGACGLQRQFIDEENLKLAAGTYHDLRIDLTASHGSHGSFNEEFGEAGSGSPLIPTALELFFSKSTDGPLIVNIDNVRVGTGSAGVPGDYNGNGSVDAADYVQWRNGGPLLNEVNAPGTVNAADYTEWRSRFGNSGSGAGLGGGSSVPEPGSALLMLVASGLISVGNWRSAR